MAIPRELGRYELLIELGRGGMAELFLGRLHGAGGFAKLVAIKRILPHLAQDKQFTEMFLNEGRIAARLSHPNVCGVFELVEDAGELFLAMEYLDGVTWDQLVRTLAPGNAPLVAGVLAQAAEGLHYAHTLRDLEGNATSIVHRDVSPQNLFVTVDGICKVLDFGVSKMMTDGPRTRSGVVKGKLPYMAPEQLRAEDLDGRADVFALGACAWEALTGVRLFDRETDFLIWKAITEEPIPPIAQYWPACPPVLEAVVRRALERDRTLRQPTARAFADELRDAAGGDVAELGEIADAVRAQCADQLATRQVQVQTAIGERRASIPPGPADTIADADASETVDIRMRDESLRVVRQPDAAETTDLRGSTSALDDGTIVPPRRGPLGLVVAGLALAALAVLVVVLVTSSRDKPSDPPRVASVGSSGASDASSPSDASGAASASGSSSTPETPDKTRPDKATPDKAKRDKPRSDKKPDKPDTRPATPARSGEPGFFSIDSKPYATIFANGKRLDDTPLFRHPLAPGKYTIRAVLADGREKTIAIVIESGREVSSGRLTW
jgi:serine/threonine-protein kinase